MSARVVTNDSVYFLKQAMLGQGETSKVFPGYPEGETSSATAGCAIKLAKDADFNNYIEKEFATIQTLRQTLRAMPRGARAFPDVMPLPQVELAESTDRRKALVIDPILSQSLLAAFESLSDPAARQQLALTAARQYIDLLQALDQARITCQDRKLSDLWWVGSPEAGHLVVTDWNVLSDTFNPVLDLRRFGLLWFELLIGSHMPPDFQPRRQDFDQIQDKISYGLWCAVARSLGPGMGPQFCHSRELADTLEILAQFYHQTPSVLAQQARDRLNRAKNNLDQTHADWAWIQFDMAQRLDGGQAAVGLDQARLWAIDPVAQAAPGLVRKLASPQFLEIEDQLQELKNKVQRPQELGAITRAQFGFDLLNVTREALITAGATSDLAEMAHTFTQIQELLVAGVLEPLNEQDGIAAQKNIEQLLGLFPSDLPAEGVEKIKSLEQEALFWVEYNNAQKALHRQPHLAVEPLEQCQEVRPTIQHWSAAYRPTLDDLERLQEIANANLRSAILAGEISPTLDKTADHFEDRLSLYARQMDHLDEQADRFLILTQILEDRKQSLQETIAFYESLAEAEAVETQTFLANTLRLYLTTAQAQLEADQDAAPALDRAERLLIHIKPLLPQQEWDVYQDLYDHLLELSTTR